MQNILSHHLLPATVPHSSPFIDEQSKGLRLCRLQLLLLREDHSVKVWQWLGLELRYLESSQETGDGLTVFFYTEI